MTLRKPLLLTLAAAGALAFGGSLLAQDMPPPAPAAASSAAMAPAATSADQDTFQTAQGQVTVRSVTTPAPTMGPPPSFEQLSGGAKSITEAQAAAYPPLANDFAYADSNRNGSISKAEYERWTKQL